MNITRICRKYLLRTVEAESRAALSGAEGQRMLLQELVHAAASTAWGRDHGFGKVRSYGDYRRAVLPEGYEAFRPLVMRMIDGERDVLWPGVTRRYAQSSGTSDGKSKYVPLTERSLERNHLAGARLSVASYLATHPDSRMFGGAGLILGGSYANELDLRPGVRVGDLSATLIDRTPPLAELVRVPAKSTALMADWEKKLPLLVEQSRRRDVRSLSGVPSWMMGLLRKLMEQTGAQSVHEVWPNLEVFFHGGIAFGPYREQYDAVTDPEKMHYWENYNASEGFFGVQSQEGRAPMRLLMNGDTFYEFIPVEGSVDDIIPCWMVELGKIYELVITSSNGLWRYRLGDTVKIEGLRPLEITIVGRTRHFINAFGEEVMVYNTDAALAETCRRSGAEVSDYTAAPVYAEGKNKGHHQWLIEFVKPPRDLGAFAAELDRQLCAQNSDYQAKRDKGLFLDPLEITVVPAGTFARYLSTTGTGRLGGQRKVPRLSNDRTIADALLALIEATPSNR